MTDGRAPPSTWELLLSRRSVMLFPGGLYLHAYPLLLYQAGSASPQAAGLVMGAYGLSQMILRIPLGVLSDPMRRRKPFILLGFAFDGLANLELILSGSTWTLFLSVFTPGIAASMRFPLPFSTRVTSPWVESPGPCL